VVLYEDSCISAVGLSRESAARTAPGNSEITPIMDGLKAVRHCRAQSTRLSSSVRISIAVIGAVLIPLPPVCLGPSLDLVALPIDGR
jgi:hypothetical protein